MSCISIRDYIDTKCHSEIDKTRSRYISLLRRDQISEQTMGEDKCRGYKVNCSRVVRCKYSSINDPENIITIL